MGGGADALELRLLGAFTVCLSGRAIDTTRWRVKKAASLVKILALTPSHRRTRDELMDCLWPDLAPDAAANNLRYTLHIAREELGATALVSDGRSIRLPENGTCRIDLAEFETAAATARRSRSRDDWVRAVTLYRGDVLPDDVYEDWSILRREEMRATYHALLRQMANGPGAIEALERLVSSDPTDEPARVRLMKAYADAGQPEEARRHYELLVAALRDSDVAPEPATTALVRSLGSLMNR